MFLGPPLNFAPPPQIYVFAQVPCSYFGLKVLGPPLKLGVEGGGGGGCYHDLAINFSVVPYFTVII